MYAAWRYEGEDTIIVVAVAPHRRLTQKVIPALIVIEGVEAGKENATPRIVHRRLRTSGNNVARIMMVCFNKTQRNLRKILSCIVCSVCVFKVISKYFRKRSVHPGSKLSL